MLSLPKRRFSGVGTRVSPARCAIAWLTVIFFCFPLARFYLVPELTPITCLDHDHSHTVALPSEHSHSSEFLPADHDNGFFFQHCKDKYEAMSLTSLPTLGVPATVSIPPLEPTPTIVAPASCRFPEADFRPPFPPPRHRS